MKKLNIAIIGQGRSGKDIHGAYYVSPANDLFNVRYVVEKDERRRKISLERYKGCDVLCDYTELFDKKDIDLVVNASYSYYHYPITKDLLSHGFNVLVEKPFSKTTKECDDLIKTAKKKGVKLFVFQQTFYAPYYRFLVKSIKEQLVGEMLQMSIRYNGLSRRWDWQSLIKTVGGNAYNTGPHPIGVALGVLDFDKKTAVAFSRAKNTEMFSGDADSFLKAIITAPNKPFIDIEITSHDGFGDGYMVKVQGTKGTITCNELEYKYRYIIDGENEPRPVQEEFLQDENGNPLYCFEQLIKHEESGKFEGDTIAIGAREFYKDVYKCLTEGKEMYFTLEDAKKVIELIESIHKNNPLKQRLF